MVKEQFLFASELLELKMNMRKCVTTRAPKYYTLDL